MWNWSKLTKLTCHLIEHSDQLLALHLAWFSTTAFNWEPPSPPHALPCSHKPPSPPPPFPSSHHPSMHLASRTTSRNQVAAGHQNHCPTSHTKTLHAGRLPNNHTEESVTFVNHFPQQYLWLFQPSLPKTHGSNWSSLWLVVAIGCTWLLSPVVPPVSSSFFLSNSLFFTTHYSWTGCIVF